MLYISHGRPVYYCFHVHVKAELLMCKRILTKIIYFQTLFNSQNQCRQQIKDSEQASYAPTMQLPDCTPVRGERARLPVRKGERVLANG